MTHNVLLQDRVYRKIKIILKSLVDISTGFFSVIEYFRIEQLGTIFNTFTALYRMYTFATSTCAKFITKKTLFGIFSATFYQNHTPVSYTHLTLPTIYSV